MSDAESVTQWISMLKDGQQEASQKIWSRYVERLIRLANQKLLNAPRKMADEEDVVICAFEAFLRGAEAGRFSQLDDRDDLWQVLVMLTERKAVDHLRHELAQKRGGGRVKGTADYGDTSRTSVRIHELADSEPTPEIALQASEELRSLLRQLGDAELHGIAMAKLEGYKNAEIAERLGKSLSSVERKLGLIRDIWTEETS